MVEILFSREKCPKMCLKINWPRFLEYFSNQYVFRNNHSTANALIQLYDKLLDATDQEKVTLGLIINLSIARPSTL